MAKISCQLSVRLGLVVILCVLRCQFAHQLTWYLVVMACHSVYRVIVLVSSLVSMPTFPMSKHTDWLLTVSLILELHPAWCLIHSFAQLSWPQLQLHHYFLAGVKLTSVKPTSFNFLHILFEQVYACDRLADLAVSFLQHHTQAKALMEAATEKLKSTSLKQESKDKLRPHVTPLWNLMSTLAKACSTLHATSLEDNDQKLRKLITTNVRILQAIPDDVNLGVWYWLPEGSSNAQMPESPIDFICKLKSAAGFEDYKQRYAGMVDTGHDLIAGDGGIVDILIKRGVPCGTALHSFCEVRGLIQNL